MYVEGRKPVATPDAGRFIGFRVQGLGCRVSVVGIRFKAQDLLTGFRV